MEHFAVACEASVATTTSCTGPDHQPYTDQSSFVNWLSENSRSRRTQTTLVSAEVEIQTDQVEIKPERPESKEMGTDPIVTSDPSNSSLGGSMGAISSSSGPLSLPEGDKAEPREFDPFFNDENEIIYLFRSKSTDPEEDSEGEGEMRTLICKETRDIAVGPDGRDIQEEAIKVIQELMHENPEDFDRILGLQKCYACRDPECETPPDSEPDSDPKAVISAADGASYSKDFGTSQECPLMTDIEERYELPDNLVEECIQLHTNLVNGVEPQVPKQLKREWFAVSSKPNSSALVVDDFLSGAAECSSKEILSEIINSFDLNGNCALHYAISHSNLDVVRKGLTKCHLYVCE